jgi:hypothetical protein
MSTCPGCGGVVGRDCFNPSECEWISRSMEADAAAERINRHREEEEYWRGLEAEHRAAQEQDYLTYLFAASVAPELAEAQS